MDTEEDIKVNDDREDEINSSFYDDDHRTKGARDGNIDEDV